MGAPHYTAPEVILGCGHGFLVDWWSLGVMIYEFMYCAMPFGDQENDPQAIFESILAYKLELPDDGDACKLIGQLLSKQPESRLRGSIDKLKSHPWLHSIDWGAIKNRT